MLLSLICFTDFAKHPSSSSSPKSYRVGRHLSGSQSLLMAYPMLLRDTNRGESLDYASLSFCSLITLNYLSPVRPYHYHAEQLVQLWPRRYGLTSLLRYASYLGHFQTHSIINWKLFFLTVLEPGARLSSFLEEVLCKSLNKRMNEWMNEWGNEWMNEWGNEWMNEWMIEWRVIWRPSKATNQNGSWVIG